MAVWVHGDLDGRIADEEPDLLVLPDVGLVIAHGPHQVPALLELKGPSAHFSKGLHEDLLGTYDRRRVLQLEEVARPGIPIAPGEVDHKVGDPLYELPGIAGVSRIKKL